MLCLQLEAAFDTVWQDTLLQITDLPLKLIKTIQSFKKQNLPSESWCLIWRSRCSGRSFPAQYSQPTTVPVVICQNLWTRSFHCFAHETAITATARRVDHTNIREQKHLLEVASYLPKSKLKLNTDKFQLMSFIKKRANKKTNTSYNRQYTNNWSDFPKILGIWPE